MTTATAKTRIITLTDRAPVRITESEWPVIAKASDRPGSMRNGTPVPDYETDLFEIRVRQHADGRAIVYGRVDAATAWTGTQGWSGGELLDAPNRNAFGDESPRYSVSNELEWTQLQKIVAAIRRVGEDAGMPDSVIRECIADLPAVEL